MKLLGGSGMQQYRFVREHQRGRSPLAYIYFDINVNVEVSSIVTRWDCAAVLITMVAKVRDK